MPSPELSVVIVGAPDQNAREAARTWDAFLGSRGIRAEVVPARGAFETTAIELLRRARGEYVLIVDGSDTSAPWFGALWEDRHAAGLVLAEGAAPDEVGGRRIRERSRGLALRACQRLLSLPVLPEARVIFYRRAALTRAPQATRRFEWLLEVIVLANSEGWPVRRLVGSGGLPAHPVRLRLGTLRRLWVLRNSAFSADYDERAFNSLIPLQRYWQRRRHHVINRWVDPRTRILDVGCGSSRIVQDLPQAVGLDVQIKKLRRISTRTHKVVQATLTRLPFRSGSFQTLICSQVIEHVPEHLVDWREMNRVLTSGGTFVVGTPDYATIAWPFLERLYAIVHPRGYVHEHINRYTAASLRHALDAHGFQVEASAYVGRAELIIKARKVKECR